MDRMNMNENFVKKTSFGGIDLMSTQDEVVEYIGGRKIADRLFEIYNSSTSPHNGRNHMGEVVTKKDLYVRRAMREGFTVTQISTFYSYILLHGNS